MNDNKKCIFAYLFHIAECDMVEEVNDAGSTFTKGEVHKLPLRCTGVPRP